MHNLTRITFNPEVMGGKPCIRGMRVTVGTIVGLGECEFCLLRRNLRCTPASMREKIKTP